MFPILFIVVCLIVLLVVIGPMRTPRGSWRHWRDTKSIPHGRAFDILNERLARGEIDKSEHDEKRRVISQGG